MRFEFATANRILFGPGCLQEVARFAAGRVETVMVVTGRNRERAQPLLQDLKAHDLKFTIVSINGEPTVDTVGRAADQTKTPPTDLVIGFGGGSAIDAGKAIAALAANPGDPYDYLEVIGKGRPLEKPPLPYVAVPTTAGTGSEVTRNAVLKSTREQVKVSLRSPLMLPRLAIVDPELTLTLPPDTTAATGMDALTQLWEAFVSSRANPLTDALCREGLARAARSIKRAFARPQDLQARRDMCLASLFSGMALANAGLGAVHGIAGPLGGMCDAPHGAACARLLPLVARTNLKALLEKSPDSPSLTRFEQAAQIVTRSASAAARDGIAWLQALCDEFKIPSLTAFGFEEKQAPQLADRAEQSSSMKGNPVRLTKRELEDIVRSAL